MPISWLSPPTLKDPPREAGFLSSWEMVSWLACVLTMCGAVGVCSLLYFVQA